jgi:hypothetical protein
MSDELIVLRGGASFQAVVIDLLLRLEEAEVDFVDRDGVWQVTPPQRLTSAQRMAVRRHHRELKRLVQYCTRDD